MYKRILLSCVLSLLIYVQASAQTATLLPSGSTWKYLDNGSNQGTAWQSPSFNDASWLTGIAQFGYGDGDETTVVSYGPSAASKYITTYFRTSFQVSNVNSYTNYIIRLKKDDGAIVYLNGVQVVRTNMPTPYTYLTTAPSNLNGTSENTFLNHPVAANRFINGNNVIAVEIHQYSASNDDLSFDMIIEATQTGPVCAAPSGLASSQVTATSAILNWNNVTGATGYNIRYKVNGAANYTNTTSAGNSLNLTSLTANTSYVFSVQSVCASGTSSFPADVSFTTLSLPCDPPSGLNASAITASSAVLGWNSVANAASYNIRYKINGASNYTNSASVSNSLNLSSLAANTTYVFSVQSVCSSGTSAFPADVSFTTSALPCNTPSGIYATNLTASSAFIGWDAVPNAASYNIQYRITGTPAFTNISSSVNNITLTGLQPASSYEYSIQTVCNGNTSAFSPVANFITSAGSPQTDSLITYNASWKYRDAGTLPSGSWKAVGYNETGWKTGNAQLGYGDGDESTVVSYGPNSSSKYITTYFRKTINISNMSAYNSVTMQVLRDDGIVLYVNGIEIYRNNMPSGTIGNSTLASGAIGGADESAWISVPVSLSSFINGNNCIAAEIHQNSASSSDLSFNCKLAFSTGTTVTRGPYLQMLKPDGVTIRWRTSTATASRVDYGTTLFYGTSVTDPQATTEHVINLTNLNPSTTYFYRIGTPSTVLEGDINYYFSTSDPAGTVSPVRIWVTGDFGDGSNSQLEVRNSYVNYTNSSYPADLWIWLGDNAYSTGTDNEFQVNVFNVYKNQFRNTPVYPSLGNHDYGNLGYQNSQVMGTNFPYFNIFTLPQNGEAGGVPSGTEKYYSYNYANIHFVVLDSYGALSTAGSPMRTWLQNDLAANTQRWTIVYFHHPPYTKGSHNSDSNTESIAIRQNIVPLFDTYNVDLVLCGHSHINERSYLIQNHYGNANTFNSSHKVSNATTNFIKTPPYDGTIYAVCGTSGQDPGSVQSGWPMPCMFFANNSDNCSMILDVNGDLLDAKFLTSAGNIADQFTITKNNSRDGNEISSKELNIYPNPFAGNITVAFNLESPATVTLNIFDVSGKLLLTPVNNENLQSGQHEISVPADINSGAYTVEIKIGSEVYSRKIISGK